MNTLVRSTTRNFSRRFDGYEPLDLNSETDHDDHQYGRNLSKRRKLQPHSVVKTLSYRRDRARQRQIYLKSYTLTSMENLGKSGSGKLMRKVVVKVKAVAVSVVAFIRMDSFRSCNSRSATAASSPTTPVRKCF